MTKFGEVGRGRCALELIKRPAGDLDCEADELESSRVGRAWNSRTENSYQIGPIEVTNRLRLAHERHLRFGQNESLARRSSKYYGEY